MTQKEETIEVCQYFNDKGELTRLTYAGVDQVIPEGLPPMIAFFGSPQDCMIKRQMKIRDYLINFNPKQQ